MNYAKVLKGDLPGHEFRGNQWGAGLNKLVGDLEAVRAANRERLRVAGGSGGEHASDPTSMHGRKNKRRIEGL